MIKIFEREDKYRLCVSQPALASQSDHLLFQSSATPSEMCYETSLCTSPASVFACLEWLLCSALLVPLFSLVLPVLISAEKAKASACVAFLEESLNYMWGLQKHREQLWPFQHWCVMDSG